MSNGMTAKAIGTRWKETAEREWKGLMDTPLGDLVDHGFSHIAAERAVLATLLRFYFDEAEQYQFWEDARDGKPLDEWIDRLVKAVKRGPIVWPETP